MIKTVEKVRTIISAHLPYPKGIRQLFEMHKAIIIIRLQHTSLPHHTLTINNTTLQQ